MSWSLPTPPTSPTSQSKGWAGPACSRLRRDLEAELVPDDPDVPEHKRFFPKSRVKALFTQDSIEAVLRCACPDCQEQQHLVGRRHASSTTDTILGYPNRSSYGNTGAVNIFAALVYIEYPALINCFLERQIGDWQLAEAPDEFSTERVQNIFGPAVVARFPRLARKFNWAKHKFAVPHLRDGEYRVFSSGTILPFVNETLLGRRIETGEIVSEGSYGKVYAFEVQEEYGSFADFPGIRRFARKELHANTPYKRFKAERDNLVAVKKLQDDHLVKIVMAYRHGDVFNFIFPLAKTNLHRYLRDPEYRPYLGARSFIDHPLWQQLLGLAQGLYKVQHFEEDSSAHEHSRFGYHFDLKPSNILVEESERLVITDFGQAVFKLAKDSTTSRVVGMGGTEAYAPPELDDIEKGLNRKYDIWSLGCIFIEVLTFVTRGRIGLLELDRNRISIAPGTNNTDDGFFQRNVFSHSYELKPTIIEHIKSLASVLRSESERAFFAKIQELILQMLEVDRNSRLSSKDACIRLLDILNDSRSREGVVMSDTPQVRSVSDCPGIEVGRELVERLQSVSFKVDRCWESGPVRITQDDFQLRIQNLKGDNKEGTPLGSRDCLRLVPDYALRRPDFTSSSDTSLSLVPKDPKSGDHKKCKFDFGHNFTASAALQEVFLGQEVMQMAKIKAAVLVIRQKKSVVKGFNRWRSSSKSSIELNDLGKASSVQLWRESHHRDVTIPMQSRRRQSPRSIRPGPPTRRIVVFFDNSILILRVAKNVRIDKTPLFSSPTDSQCTLVLVPTDTTADPSFSASLLRKPSGEPAPSFTLMKDDFESEEAENEVECSSLTLHFDSPVEAQSFFGRSVRVSSFERESIFGITTSPPSVTPDVPEVYKQCGKQESASQKEEDPKLSCEVNRETFAL
ncbi:kinase-like protein [Rhizodiscina lignyota]|uniref:Kinase-like protein n=1 Tax=Rhizodiscina lignyota TaxID=1504668 RepID=A0A9P4IGA2_9PEZI|nr:kinase-like protein [Rhizodiscina lignyota]